MGKAGSVRPFDPEQCSEREKLLPHLGDESTELFVAREDLAGGQLEIAENRVELRFVRISRYIRHERHYKPRSSLISPGVSRIMDPWEIPGKD